VRGLVSAFPDCFVVAIASALSARIGCRAIAARCPCRATKDGARRGRFPVATAGAAGKRASSGFDSMI
jgi:hypothetical protein